jgi:Phage integrase, N-terminal SAM-like domain
VDKPTISPVIPRISQQIRLSLKAAKSLTDLCVVISQTCLARQTGFMNSKSNSEAKTFEAANTVRSPKLFDQVRAAICTKHYSWRTEQAYVHWARRFILFHNKRHPLEMGEEEVGRFLQHLALNKGVAASTQNQALNALVFLYGSVLKRPFGKLPNVLRAKRPKRLPSVLSQSEVHRLLRHVFDVDFNQYDSTGGRFVNRRSRVRIPSSAPFIISDYRGSR